MDFQFKRKRLDTLSNKQMLDELEKVAKHFNYVEFGWRDFDKVANISAGSIKNHFGNWTKGLEALRQHLSQKGLDLSPRPHAPNRKYSDKDLFDEMERIWKLRGQRPSRTEWEMSEPKISYGIYKHRFGSWVAACSKFIEYKMGNEILADDFILPEREDKKTQRPVYKRENSRNISLSVRLKVLNRDNFRCVFCGKSPATDIGTKLHLDHIKPFSKGGKSSIENLQTLCAECNLGKSDNEEIRQNIT
ncbi:MAG: HNH endonuclease [Patescibacteria group bacterium]